MQNELLSQLGINWKLFLSQIVNFFILLSVLTFFVYKPLIKIIKERNKKISEGLNNAEKIDLKLKEIDEIKKEKIKEAENKSINIIKETEKRAKVLEQELQKKSEEKRIQMQKELDMIYKKQEEEAKQVVLKSATELVKKTLIKTIELKPEEIDDKLIKKAVDLMENEAK